MTLRGEWLRPCLAGIWIIALASALPQVSGLAAIAVAPVIEPMWRILAQLAIFGSFVLLILTDSKGNTAERWIDLFLLTCAITYAHFPAPFFDYVWDVCLIETTLVFLFSRLLIQSSRWPSWHIWPLRLLLFKLMFSMGVIKYLHGMPEWRDGTALTFFWSNQPMPGFLSWTASQLPSTWQKAMSTVVFLAEIPGPFLMFFGRRFRLVFFFINLVLQLGIFFSGNYGVFNLLTIVISLSLLERREQPDNEPRPMGAKKSRLAILATGWATIILAGWLATSAWYQYAVFFPNTRHLPETSWVFLKNPEQREMPTPLLKLLQWYAAGKVSNPYALFGHISKYRMEIEIWGSHDAVDWKKYRFRVKPDELDKAPVWYAPHHWRLDHQLYYESFRIRAPELATRYSYFLGSRWMPYFLRALFANDHRVTWLLRENPFAGKPPAYLQMRYTYYSFTDLETWHQRGDYWRTEQPHEGQFYEQVITQI